MQVPVIATLTGASELPSLLAIASNSLNPHPVIHADQIDYSVTLSRTLGFEGISSVRV